MFLLLLRLPITKKLSKSRIEFWPKKWNLPGYPAQSVAVLVACSLHCEWGEFEESYLPRGFSSLVHFPIWDPERGETAREVVADSLNQCAEPPHCWRSSFSCFSLQDIGRPVFFQADFLNWESLKRKTNSCIIIWVSHFVLLVENVLLYWCSSQTSVQQNILCNQLKTHLFHLVFGSFFFFFLGFSIFVVNFSV